MRISTANSFDSGIDSLTSRQSELSEAQARLASGKRVAKASDDPASAARAERALAAVQRSDTSQRSVDASKNAIVQTESAMGDASELLQQAREAIVGAGNGSYSDAERQSLAGSLRSIRSQLLQVANRTDGAGNYLFGGSSPSQRPFVDQPGGVAFAGTAGQLSTDNATALPLSTDGASTWLSAPTGNGVFQTSAAVGVTGASIDGGQVSNPALLTGANYALQFSVSGGVTTYAVTKNGAATAVTAAPYVSGQGITVDGMTFGISGTPATGDQFQIVPSTPTLSVFDTIDQAITDLSTPGLSTISRAQATDVNLRNLDSVMTTMQSARANAGAVLNRIDAETARIATQKETSQTEQSEAEDLDMVSAISAFQTKQSGYDAALKSYAMVQRLSLFQYLGG